MNIIKDTLFCQMVFHINNSNIASSICGIIILKQSLIHSSILNSQKSHSSPQPSRLLPLKSALFKIQFISHSNHNSARSSKIALLILKNRLLHHQIINLRHQKLCSRINPRLPKLAMIKDQIPYLRQSYSLIMFLQFQIVHFNILHPPEPKIIQFHQNLILINQFFVPFIHRNSVNFNRIFFCAGRRIKL